MTTMTTRADLTGRLARIRDRIDGRATDLADIDHRQLRAATAGDEPDPALGESRRVLLDAQAVDERAVAALTAELDQLNAADARLAALADLARLHREAAEEVRAAAAEADAYPAAQEAALDALRAAGHDLCDRRRRIDERTLKAVKLMDAARALAENLGEPVGVVGVVNHAERISGLYPVSGDSGRGSELLRARVFAAAGRSAIDTVHEIGATVHLQMQSAAMAGAPSIVMGG